MVNNFAQFVCWLVAKCYLSHAACGIAYKEKQKTLNTGMTSHNTIGLPLSSVTKNDHLGVLLQPS